MLKLFPQNTATLLNLCDAICYEIHKKCDVVLNRVRFADDSYELTTSTDLFPCGGGRGPEIFIKTCYEWQNAKNCIIYKRLSDKMVNIIKHIVETRFPLVEVSEDDLYKNERN